MARKPETIAFQRFRGRIQFLKQHLQTVDVALVNAYNLMKSEKDKTKKIADSLGHSTKKYTELNHPIKVNPRILNHSKSSTHQYTIIILHAHFSEYVKGILSEIYAHDPIRVVGNHNGNMLYSKIIELDSLDKIKEEMVDDVFRKLENQRSTQKLLDEILKKGNATISNDIKHKGMAYLEMRHLFIHSGGIADKEFVDKYSDVVSTNIGSKLPLGYPLVEGAIEAVREMCKQVDSAMINGGFVSKRAGT